MPVVACPSCGERGKIPPTLIGMRIKCKKCGIAFNVAAPVSKAPVGAELTPTVTAMPLAIGAPGEEGIAVEGLDASAWMAAGEASSGALKAVAEAEPASAAGPESADFEHHEATGARSYKLLCSRDKIFEGKFDLPRLEEVLNHYARQGWVVKSMITPHLKGFGEGTKEEVVILLER